jgi:nucleotide-binding universal stress UspA family protein
MADRTSMILIATDGSTAAREAEAIGIELAAARGDTAAFVCVWAPLRASFGVPVPEMLDSEFVDAEHTWADETLAHAAARASAAGLDAETIVAKGPAVEAICETADRRGADMIVIGSHGWGAMMSLIFGSTTLGVLQHAGCPVVVVRARPEDAARAAE